MPTIFALCQAASYCGGFPLDWRGRPAYEREWAILAKQVDQMQFAALIVQLVKAMAGSGKPRAG